ncbi:MAG TPA: N-acetylmuramoyl-L-alanine amidase [Acidobacteriota bacterium]|nr:N-acetylmuramoyl-L-alanine amidase [Acidobacteriota bacterium]
MHRGVKEAGTRRRHRWWPALLVLLWAAVPLQAFQDIEIEIGSQVSVLDSARRQGRSYYSMTDVARTFDVRLNDSGRMLTVRGPRGTARLRDGSSIVGRDRGPDVQLREPVWKRGEDDWYVSGDFLERVLRSLLDGRLTRLSPTRYRLTGLQDVEVEVRLRNYPPNRVRIVFEPDRQVPIRIDDQERVLVIDFEQYRPLMRLPRERPDVDIVASLTFDRLGRGAVRLVKGRRFERYEYLELEGPPRHVLDLYSSTPGRSSRGHAEIVLDPGHGGRDYGVVEGLAGLRRGSASQEDSESQDGEGNPAVPQPIDPGQISEKDFTLNLAQRLAAKLNRAGFSTVLTRGRDVDLNLEQRSAISNGFGPKIFLSLHLGSSRGTAPRGPIVYLHRPQSSQGLTAEALDVAEPQAGQADSKADPDSERPPPREAQQPPTAGFLPQLKPWSQAQEAHLSQSRRLASIVQGSLNDLFGSDNRVMEIPLSLLEPVDTPSLLVETGYISSSDDLRRLKDPLFQERLAEALARALERYLR